MNIIVQLQAVKDAIVELTKPPVTPQLLNKLSPAMEQAEAQADAVERQDETLATQIETIERLVKENQELKTNLARFEADPFIEYKGHRFKMRSDGTAEDLVWCPRCRGPLSSGEPHRQLRCSCGFESIYTGYHIPELVEAAQEKFRNERLATA